MASFQNILKQLEPYSANLVAVSKTKPNAEIINLYDLGQRIFGENRVQELCDKYESLPKDISWHFIGHLQSNKVKNIVSFVDMIHSIDSIKLLLEVNKQAKKTDRIINCLLQFHIGQEANKYGFEAQMDLSIFSEELLESLTHVNICGVMGMATFTDSIPQVRDEFKTLKQIYTTLKSNYFDNDEAFKELSMGMSGDYTIALEEGSTLIRIGSLLFGGRH